METLRTFLEEESSLLLRPERREDEILETLRRGLRRCHAALQENVVRHPERSGLGTTLTAALVLWPKLFMVHMGDSRAYLLREGSLRRLTEDHTYARTLLQAGVLDARTVRTSGWNNVVWNVLSGAIPEHDPEVHPDASVQELHRGDTLLLCTDGLTNALSDEAILFHLAEEGSPEEICRRLVEAAQKRGAKDDVTGVVAAFHGPEPRSLRRKDGVS